MKFFRLPLFQAVVTEILFIIILIFSLANVSVYRVFSYYITGAGIILSTFFVILYSVEYARITKTLSFETTDRHYPKWVKTVVENFFFIAIIYFLVTFIFAVFFFPARVSQSSMKPNLSDRDMVFVVHRSKLERNDIVVVNVPTSSVARYHNEKNTRPLQSEFWVKRIIGLPGDKLYFKGFDIYVNGNKLNEPFLGSQRYYVEPKGFTVPDGEYYLLGDNRAHSFDSTQLGSFKYSEIVGVVTQKVVGFFKFEKLDKKWS